MKKICAVGSLNMDLVAVADRFPKPGETIIGKEFHTFPGGKGANQAVAVGRLGADARMVGKVGDDLFGQQYLGHLKTHGVRLEGVGVEAGVSTGIAVIEVDGTGENHILIIPGANGRVDQAYFDQQLEFMLECDIFLFQLEVPLEPIVYALKKTKAHGKINILDPAPAQQLPEEIYSYVDYLTPNETEIAILAGGSCDTEENMHKAAKHLLAKGVGTVILKAGQKGAYIIGHNEFRHVPGFRVDAVDTTGAGDSFNAGLAVALSLGYELTDGVRFANAVGALSTTAKGAQNAMPGMEQVWDLLRSSPPRRAGM